MKIEEIQKKNWIQANWQIIMFVLLLASMVGQYTFRLSSLEARITSLEAVQPELNNDLSVLRTDMAVVKENIQFIKETLSR